MVAIAQIGLGAWGQNHLRTFLGLEGCELRIACDKDKAALEKASRMHDRGRVRFTGDADEIMNNGDIEAVVISTSASSHAPLAGKALSAGKHVLIEKPLALNPEDGRKVVDLAAENNRILMVGHLLLYHPAIAKLKDYIKTGELGEVFYLYSRRVNLGRIRDDENALWSLTSHDISVAMHLLEDMPQEVTVKGESYLRQGVEDVVFASFKFRNKILAHVHASWLDPHKIREFTVVGSRKMAVFNDMESSEKIRLYDKGYDRQKDYGGYETFLSIREGDIHVPRIDLTEPLKIECRHFLDCVRLGKRPLTDGESGLRVLNVLAAAQKSLKAGGQPRKIDAI